MRPDLAERTYDILLYGLALRERLGRGRERPHLGTEQGKLKAMLGANTGSPWGGTADVHSSGDGHTGRDFMGIRYGLTCWLDEVLIAAGWKEWDENKLEPVLYRTNVRYSNFWTQARLAESAAETPDAHEAYLLCVLLGFRGELEHSPDQLREWVSAARNRALRHGGREPPKLPERAPPQNAPTLYGAEAYRRMTRRLVIGGVIAVPILAFLFVMLFR